MGYQEIKEVIDSLDNDNKYRHCQWLDEDSTGIIKYVEPLLGKFKVVEQYGGEGQGDNYWTVYYFEDHNIYIRFNGWYASHHGSEYEEMFEVEPEQVTVTKYNRK